MRIANSVLLTFLSGIASARALTIPHDYNAGTGSADPVALPTSADLRLTGRNTVYVYEADHHKRAPPAPAKSGSKAPPAAKPPTAAPGTGTPGKGTPAPPRKPTPNNPLIDDSILNDKYKVPYSIKAEDTCLGLILCKPQVETPELELEARRTARDVSHLTKRRDDIQALNKQLPMKVAYYYLPFELYGKPRDQDDKAVFEFVSSDVSKHEMKALKTSPVSTVNLVTEHIVELQTMGRFVEWLSDGDKVLEKNIIDHWRDKVDLKVAQKLTNVPWANRLRSTAKNPLNFNDVVFHAMGSKLNPGANVLFDKEVNGFKENIWALDDPVDKTKYTTLVANVLSGKTNSAKLHSVHRNGLAVFDYLRSKEASSRIETVVDHVTKVLGNFKQLTGNDLKDGKGAIVALDKKFNEYIRQHFKAMETHGFTWLDKDTIQPAEKKFKDKITEMKKLETTLRDREKEKDQKKRSAYLEKLKKDIETINKAKKPIGDVLDKVKKELAAIKTKVDTTESQVANEPIVSRKKSIRTKAKWQDLLTQYNDKKKEVLEQEEKWNMKLREIDMLVGRRVEQIRMNLEMDLKIMVDRKAKLKSIVKMPTLP